MLEPMLEPMLETMWKPEHADGTLPNHPGDQCHHRPLLASLRRSYSHSRTPGSLFPSMWGSRCGRCGFRRGWLAIKLYATTKTASEELLTPFRGKTARVSSNFRPQREFMEGPMNENHSLWTQLLWKLWIWFGHRVTCMIYSGYMHPNWSLATMPDACGA